MSTNGTKLTLWWSEFRRCKPDCLEEVAMAVKNRLTYNQQRLNLPIRLRGLWMYLASYDPCYPTQLQIASDNQLSINTVKKYLRQLESIGLIRINRAKKGKTYQGLWFEVFAEPNFKSQLTVSKFDTVKSKQRYQNRTSTVSNGDHQRYQTLTPKGSMKDSKKEKNEKETHVSSGKPEDGYSPPPKEWRETLDQLMKTHRG